eukprot:scaffold8037_cov578-Prasinococcus_capsulatus_cf.AAC.1
MRLLAPRRSTQLHRWTDAVPCKARVKHTSLPAHGSRCRRRGAALLVRAMSGANGSSDSSTTDSSSNESPFEQFEMPQLPELPDLDPLSAVQEVPRRLRITILPACAGCRCDAELRCVVRSNYAVLCCTTPPRTSKWSV